MLGFRTGAKELVARLAAQLAHRFPKHVAQEVHLLRDSTYCVERSAPDSKLSLSSSKVHKFSTLLRGVCSFDEKMKA